MITTLLDIVTAGLLLGGIYALIAVGLSIQYGVARVLNIAHGEFIMLGAFITWTLFTLLGINPMLSLAVSGPALFILGLLIYRTLLARLRKKSATPEVFEGNAMLACFGLIFIIQNAAILIWNADIKGYSFWAFPIRFGGVTFAANRLVTLAFASLFCLVFYLFLARTRMGKAIRAAAQDAEIASLMGIDIDRVLGLCFGFGALLAGLGGSLISISYNIQPTMGLEYTMIALIVIVLGGLGSIPGSFLGGLFLGLAGSIVSHIEPGLAIVTYYAIFMLLLLIKPKGLLGTQ